MNKDNILKVAQAIEDHKNFFDMSSWHQFFWDPEDTNLKPPAWSEAGEAEMFMKYVERAGEHTCGTSACIGGWAQSVFLTEDRRGYIWAAVAAYEQERNRPPRGTTYLTAEEVAMRTFGTEEAAAQFMGMSYEDAKEIFYWSHGSLWERIFGRCPVADEITPELAVKVLRRIAEEDTVDIETAGLR